MNSESRFYALEVMCRERAAVARREFEYWLAGAEEWAQLKLSCRQQGASSARSRELSHPLSSKRDFLPRCLWREWRDHRIAFRPEYPFFRALPPPPKL